LGFHHPVNNTSTGTTAKAVKEVGFWTDVARWGLLLMEGAANNMVFALLGYGMTLAFDQAQQRYIALNPVDYLVR
jgi:hypothetical protein